MCTLWSDVTELLNFGELYEAVLVTGEPLLLELFVLLSA